MQQRQCWPDLSAHSASKLEWWFVQGQFESGNDERRCFMLSLFRQAPKQGGDDVHMALLSVLDPQSGRHYARSQVSPRFVENFLNEAPSLLRKWGIEDRLAESFIDELNESGVPAPIRIESSLPDVTSGPFEAIWGDILLRQNDNTITIGFTSPEDGRSCFFEATSCCGWLAEESFGGGGGVGEMAHHSCPRLELTGTIENIPICGNAWIDHQWGDFGWFRGADGDPRLLGWDWFGINLSNGTDLIVLVHRDMRSGQAHAASASVFRNGKQIEAVEDVTTTATRHWLSPETMIDYPVAWDIDIPSISASLKFEPATDNQEIQVFGFISAIWEGTGTVSGRIGKQSVSGNARLELQGYGYIHDFKAYQDQWIDRIDRNIKTFFPATLDHAKLCSFLGPPRWNYDTSAHTEMLSKPVWDLLARGGKHWRPIFGILLLEALGIEAGPFETALSVIPELEHNASVIIDDIEDASQTRRGDQTIHLKYGLPTAINAANTLYFLPLLSISGHEHLCTEQREAIYRAFMEMFVQAHFGQAQDLYWSKLDPARRAELWHDENLGDLILQAHTFKTAAPVRVTAEFACIIAKADQETRIACTRFAESIGIAFQIIDDVNNFSNTQGWGKVRGEDIIEGKFSFAIHKAVHLLEGANRKRLTEILASEELRRTEAGLNEAIRLIENSGALEACRHYAQELMDKDWPAFSRVLPASRQKLMLRILLTRLIDLPFNSQTGSDPLFDVKQGVQ